MIQSARKQLCTALHHTVEQSWVCIVCVSASQLLPAWRIFSRLPTAACQRTFKKKQHCRQVAKNLVKLFHSRTQDGQIDRRNDCGSYQSIWYEQCEETQLLVSRFLYLLVFHPLFSFDTIFFSREKYVSSINRYKVTGFEDNTSKYNTTSSPI